MAVPTNNTQPSRVATRLTHETHTSKLAENERKAVAKASKVSHPSRETQLPILKHTAKLLKR
jgi:ribosomal protein L32